MDFSSYNPGTTNALNIAARMNDVHNVKRLLKKVNPNNTDNRGWTCLHEAAGGDSYESLLLILEHPDTRLLDETHEGQTALFIACQHTSTYEIIKTLLDHCPDLINFGNTEDVTPLHVCSGQGRLDIMQLLIDYNAMIDVQDSDGDTPLHDAALNAEPEAVDLLLHAGADPEILNSVNYTPFHLACCKGCLQTAKRLFPFVININQVTAKGETPLILASLVGSFELVQFLLENGADTAVRNNNGDLALNAALNYGHSDIFKLLLSATDVIKIDRKIILKACKPHYFKFEIIECLLTHDLGPEFFDFIEQFHVTLEKIGDLRPTYFINAPINSYLNICEYIYNSSPEKFKEFFILFLMRGVSVNSLDLNECPPLVYLHYCMHSYCFKEVFKILIEHGCNVDYCSALSCIDKEKCVPDAFLASLTSDPTTMPIMIPYSLYCEPVRLLQFAFENGVLDRIPQKVQDQLLMLMGVSDEGVSALSLPYYTFPLKHFCRATIRSHLRNRKCALSTSQFMYIINKLVLPNPLKRYLCYM